VTRPSVDVVIPFFNGVRHVKALITTLKEFTPDDVQVYLVNDGSDFAQRGTVVELIGGDPRYVLIDNPTNEGFVASVNRGIGAGTGEIVILLNSDTLVTPYWVDGLVGALESGPSVGVVCPVSGHANFTRIDLPSGTDFLTASEHVWRRSEGRRPEIGIASGFCLAARRSLYNELGLYDPAYGRGYFEESDFCLRAMERGWRIIGDDKTFVFHQGWGTFGSDGRNQALEHNREVFERRWGRAHDYWHERFVMSKPFAYLHDWPGPQPPNPNGQTPRLRDLMSGNFPLLETWRGLDREGWDRLAGTAHVFGKGADDELPSVLFILPGIGPFGGIISVIQLANRLILNGVKVSVAAPSPLDMSDLREPMYFAPIPVESVADLAVLPRHDIVVATRWDTAYPALALGDVWGATLLAFVQGYEPDFYDRGTAERDAAALALELIQLKVVKTSWLRDKLQPFGGRIELIPLGLDLDVFFPRSSDQPIVPRVITSTRPQARYRNFQGTLDIARGIREARPDVNITFFGPHFELDDPPAEHVGPLTQDGVARLLRLSTVLLDASLFQGFGRPGLEAMASGIPSVLTNRGGIGEYARHGENCLQFDPYDVEGGVEAVLSLLEDTDLVSRLAGNGLETAALFSLDLEADRWLTLVEEITGVKPSLARRAANLARMGDMTTAERASSGRRT
jgi:GT2 family glycosyltransferase/glycosyltransferase involved in cell wall biosynthesis